MAKSRLLNVPGFPDTAVTHVMVAASAIDRLSEPLNEYGVEAVIGPYSPGLPFRTADHPDMCCRHLGGETLMLLADANTRDFKLNTLGFKLRKSALPGGSKYPGDAILNAMLLSGFVFHRGDATDPALSEALIERGYDSVNVNQGYTACSTAAVTPEAAMTADGGIAAAMRRVGIDVLELTPGYINLPGYDYGFIGGACGKLAPDVLAFTGNLDLHPDKTKIEQFLAAHGVKAVYLSEQACFDCGGIIPLSQR